jgi:heterodisulfide reductase subunit A-like polyferredoxin
MAAIPGNENIGSVLVCGAGIAGIQAALDLAESGFKVYLLEASAAIGGRMAQLDKTFPTGDCAMCILSPKLVECARNRNIEIITLADVQAISGSPGKFSVKIRQNPRYVDLKKCDACGDCNDVCPVSLPNEFDQGMNMRKAIFQPYPQTIPNVFSISKAPGQAPCKIGCPAGVNVQGFVALIGAGKLEDAYELMRQRCPLPASSGRVCRHSCQGKCHRNEIDESLSIRALERFVADSICENRNFPLPEPLAANSTGGRIAVIGSGPAGLTAANDLALMGYQVTIFEAQAHLGGMLRYGIPAFRLPKDVLENEIQSILNLGVEARTNTRIDKPKELLTSGVSSKGNSSNEPFQAVFVASGAWASSKLSIPGEDAEGVYPAVDFLAAVNSGKAPSIGSTVMVIGGTDLALDTARCALRLPGVKTVHLACLENRSEMSADSEEISDAVKESVIFHNSFGPTRLNTVEGAVESVTFRACTSVYDEYKRFDPLYDDSQVTTLVANTVLVATGRSVQASGFGLDLRPGGRIFADPGSLATSVKGIFAGGDAVLGPASMAEAMAQGHKAAEAIDAYLQGSMPIRDADISRPATPGVFPANPIKLAPNPRPGSSRQDRVPMPRAENSAQLRNMAEINLGYRQDQAALEARRCLACGLCSECMLCVKACSAGAILHEQRPSEYEIEVGSVILAPGMEEFSPSLWKEFGSGRYANVLSSMQFEQLLSNTGPTGGHLQRPSDGGTVKKLAFLQCIGSRDAERGNGYCSSVCCMSTAKEALIAAESVQRGSLDISIFCTDVRAFGKEFDSYVEHVREDCGVRYIHACPSRVTELQDGKELRIDFTDQAGAESHQEFDLIVLSTGIQTSLRVKEMAGRLGVELNSSNLAQTHRFSPLVSSRPGIYVAGAFQEPKDIPESIGQGSAAAACAMGQLTSVRGTLIHQREYPWERDVTDEAPRIGVFICQCGHNISSVVDVNQVSRKASGMSDVYYTEAAEFMCSDGSQQHIKEMIRKHRLNRMVVASCSSRTHEELFQETLRESGLNRYLLAMTNIRDQCAWVHREDAAAATAKAIDLVAMAIARARRLKALPLAELPVTASALILGGGLAGMTAAQNIAGQGFKVHLVERQSQLGGLLTDLRSTLEHDGVRDYLQQLVAQVRSHPNIQIYLNSDLVGISGQAGNFASRLNVAGTEITVDHGVVIIATGGEERSTEQHLHGRNPQVVTQRKLESMLASGSPFGELGDGEAPTVVMIQCVESRDEQNPYCSRVCCSEAIKNALEIKRLRPNSKVVILGRDMRTYGLRELYYQKALKQGVQFMRHTAQDAPKVTEKHGRLAVAVHDASTNSQITLHPDWLVLSTGIAPAAENAALSRMLRSALSSDGFFQEAHPKLRPVDSANEGEFICGLAHSPRFIDETIAQAQAAAARASTILSKPQLEIVGHMACVNPDFCVACATCVRLCPYGAPIINEYRKAEIQGAKCIGCGSCVAACPARTVTLQQQEGETVVAMLDELLVQGDSL